MYRGKAARALAVAGMMICLPVRLWPQASRGSIAGVVRDTSGAVIPGALVTAAGELTGSATSVRSQQDGAFLVPQLEPATYRLTGEAVGFKKLTIDGLKVNVDTTTTQDLVLEVGATTETIQVKGQTSLVETTNGAVGTTVQVTHVLEIPLVNRDVFNLANLVPGAFYNGTDVSIGGGRYQTAAAMVDGVNDSRGGLAVANIELHPPVDSMQEFKIEVNAYGADLGRTVGGVVNAVTKSGTNQFHGTFYEFVRNDKFDARGWGADANPPLRRNNFGASVGGPVIRNRTFFFYNFDATIQDDGVVRTRNVGLPAWRTGDFSTLTRDAGGRAAPVMIYDPNTGAGTFTNPIGTSPFPGNIIPQSRLDPVAVKAMTYIPNPNRPANDPFNQTGNWQQNAVNVTHTGYNTARVDQDWTAATKMFFRYIFTKPESNLTGYTPGYGVADPDGLDILDHRQNMALNTTRLFSATKFLNVTLGVNRVWIHRESGNCCGTNYGQLFGLPNVPGEAFPRFNFNGGLVPVDAIGATGNANRIATITNTDFNANMTQVHGQHTFKYGIQYTRFNGNDLSRPSPGGTWTSNGQYTRGINASGGNIANTGANLADFLLGRLSQITSQTSPGIGDRLQYYAGYVQDDWRVSSRLTLNLGLRYETESPIYEVANRMSNFDPYQPNPLAGTGDIPAGAMGVVDFENRNGNGKYLWDWNTLNFAPRFGFAWRVFGTNDTVVRGGFGLFYGGGTDRELVQELRAGFDNVYQARIPVTTTLSQGVPADALAPIPVSELVPTFGDRNTDFHTSTIQWVDQHKKTPHTMNFNVTIQHQWKGILFEVGGLGNLGRQLDFSNINVNLIPPALLSDTSVNQRFRRPYTIFDSDQAQVQILGPSWGISNYLAFTFKSERRYQSGWGWVVAYTFSRWIDNLISFGTPEGDNDQIQNIYNIRGERSNSTNDIPQRLVVSPIYELPFGKGKKWMTAGIGSKLFGGWQLATIGTLQSGSPFGVTVNNGPLNLLGDNANGTVLRPDLVSSSLLSPAVGQPAVGVRGIQYLNPGAFANPPAYTHGNASRTLPGVYGPGLVSFDLMLARNFAVRERWRLQIRWETFDFANHPQWALPNESLGGSAFGIVTGTVAASRRIMQFGAKLYW